MSKQLNDRVTKVTKEFIELSKPFFKVNNGGNRVYIKKDHELAVKLVDMWEFLSKTYGFKKDAEVYKFFEDQGYPNCIEANSILNSALRYPHYIVGENRTIGHWNTLDVLLDPEAGYTANSESNSDYHYFDNDIGGGSRSNAKLRQYTAKIETVIAKDRLFRKSRLERTTTPKVVEIDAEGKAVVTATTEQLDYNDPLVASRVPYYGVELEVLCKKSAPDDIIARIHKELDNHVIVKRDGSLDVGGVSGFEIVSAPATFLAHKELWPIFFDDEVGSSQFLRAWNTGKCGIHIHMSRVAFTQLHLAKFVEFINHPVTRDFVTDVAGRANNSYASYSKLNSKFNVIDDERHNHAGTRGAAVNLLNEHTVEVRIFRGNVKKAGFFKCLEFLDALYYYTKMSSMNTESMSVEDFLNWVKRNNNGYGNFVNWLKMKEYIEDNKPIKSNWREACA